MAEWKEISKSSVLRKGYQICYSKSEFGFYVGMQKVHISIPKGDSNVAPYGCRRGQNMVGLWNPNTLCPGDSDKANVYIPKNRIIRIRKEIKR